VDLRVSILVPLFLSHSQQRSTYSKVHGDKDSAGVALSPFQAEPEVLEAVSNQCPCFRMAGDMFRWCSNQYHLLETIPHLKEDEECPLNVAAEAQNYPREEEEEIKAGEEVLHQHTVVYPARERPSRRSPLVSSPWLALHLVSHLVLWSVVVPFVPLLVLHFRLCGYG